VSTTALTMLASGALAYVGDGRVTLIRCSWLCRVPSHNPEPDSESDRWSEFECGATVRVHPGYPNTALGDVTRCDAGHDHLACAIDLAPYGPAWEREQADRFGPSRR